MPTANVTLFSFDLGDDRQYKTILRSSADPTFTQVKGTFIYNIDQPHYPEYENGDIVARICKGTTEYQYKFNISAPTYVDVIIIANSSYCSYVPPVCDIAKVSLTTTPETAAGANDGTANGFFSSSKLPIAYVLLGPSNPSNTTGYFTGLEPGDYIFRATDAIGCQINTNITIAAFDTTKTNEKYRLSFQSVLNKISYQLRFLYTKQQFDPTQYPKLLEGTESPVIRKTTNSDEDKTAAFAPSSLEINLIANDVFEVSEFAAAAERDWKVELYKLGSATGASDFNGALTESISPSFVDGGLQVKQNGVVLYTINSSGSNTGSMNVGSPYSIEAFVQIAPTDPNAKIRLTVTRGVTVIYDKQIAAIVGNSLFKTGITQDEDYQIQVTTIITTTPVTEINLDDNTDPNYVLDWQGWLLPDELQDFYADKKYAIQMTATDGLLSLKGSTFGDLSQTYTNNSGVTSLLQLFGLKKWGHLVKICLEQLGYDFGLTTILSSLSYQTFKGGIAWLNYTTWADQFYDSENQPKDTYSALEILLKGMHLQIVQQKGKFVLWDINDAYWQISKNISAYCYETDFTTIAQGKVPDNQPIGINQPNLPFNPMQTLNYDKAYSQMEADIAFNLLALLFNNPSFELNAVQGDVPQGMVKDVDNIQAFDNYDPQDPLNPNVGAFAGDWELRVIGRVLLLESGPASLPVTQGSTQCLFSRDSGRNVLLSSNIVVDQPNKKVSVSFYWRPVKFSDSKNPCPRYAVTYTDGTSGQFYIWTPYSKNEYQGTGWFHPDHDFCFIGVEQQVTDYVQWNNFSITTDRLPETGIGEINFLIGTALEYPLDISSDPALDKIIDYDALVITLSDANDVYNFQNGEKHIVTNVTTYAKSEKKTVDLELFTYPNNKRLSGNVSYGDDYLTAKITNEWFFALSVEQQPDRLPANIIRRLAKNYQRPMYKWEGSIKSDICSFYSVWLLTGYLTKAFIPFNIEHNLRNSTADITLIEDEDNQMQSNYQYLPMYEKSARNNLS